MPALLLELFSEELPARMQQGAAENLARLITESLAPLTPQNVQTFHGPRRIALAATVAAQVPAASITERGPRTSAPPQALEGFLRKHAATRGDLTDDNGHWVLTRSTQPTQAEALIATALPALLRRFPWPKSMRWGTGSQFTWVRPLRRILCTLDGATVPFTLADNADDGHGLHSGNETEGHRFHAPGPVATPTLATWQATLLARHVIPDAPTRRQRIHDGITALATAENLVVVPDPGLLDEVANLCEWPVPLLGSIDAAYMDLPPEVMQVSMRVNQRYFALRHPDGTPAPRFAFAANIEASDGGTAIVAGNERVLRARFSDARHFWDLDRQTPLADRVPALSGITFHAKLGTQAARVARLEALARHIAPHTGANPDHAARAARLAKADLTTGMVGEFPELQGVMGGYYAEQVDDKSAEVAAAVREHYAPRGPSDPVPTAPIAMTVALADKLDQLAAFFTVGEMPTGSGDPYGLRRSALGVIRILRENGLRLSLKSLLTDQIERVLTQLWRDQMLPPEYEKDFVGVSYVGSEDRALRHIPQFSEAMSRISSAVLVLLAFVADRLRVQLRTEGARHDVLSAVFATGQDDDIVRLLARTDAIAGFLATPDGINLLAGARRAANIVRIEDKKDGPHTAPPDPTLLAEPAEHALATALDHCASTVASTLQAERYTEAMAALAALRPHLDTFFDQVTVNAPDPALRLNRLRLLSRVGATMATVADFSRIEG